MKIDHSGAAPGKSPTEPGFVGNVDIAGYFARETPSRLAGATVRFAPGARTPWKTNPVGQTLTLLEGVGRAQQEGGDVYEIRAGDVVWCPPGVRHWDGAAPDETMTYVAVQELSDGVGVQFFEEVDEQTYPAPSNRK